MMSDLFALMGESPRPWLDQDQLKATYHRLTTEHHPDVAGAGETDFAEINRAYQTLADPVARLRHLLELESPSALARTQQAPKAIANLFIPVAGASQAADAFLKKHSAAGSPLAKALLSTEQFAIQERIEQTLAILQEHDDRLIAELRQADALWLADRGAALRQVAALWQSLGYIAKWLAALRETLFRIATL